ncbi:MAG: TolC family protein, partial [Puniceicoccales bacterium]
SWMRITGACIGAALALIAAIWIIPLSSSIWILFVVVGTGSAIAAWVSLSSPRIYYAGRQIALAQFMLISHSFGPSTDLSVLTDRLLGIILGNIMMALSYKYLWPTKSSGGNTLQKALPVLLVCAACFIATGCTSSKDLSPASPNQAWTGPGSTGYGLPAQYEVGTHAVELDPDHEYTLSELADLAQRNNPSTRVAWEQARAAAGGIGVAESAYYPQLNLMVSAGYEHVAFPLPTNVFEQGYFYSQIAILEPEVQLDWILWDFGRQQAAVRGAKESATAQNFSFNHEHQQVLFDVCSAYYKLINIRSQQIVMEAALKEANLVEESTQTALKQGFATQAELLQAQQFVAQCNYDVTVLRGERRKAEISLAESVGANPGQVLKIKALTETPLPANLNESVESLINYALANRPDLQAMVAELRAAEANVDQVEAQRGPTLIATGNVGPGYSSFKADDMSWVDSHDLLYGVGLGLQFPLFDGFRRQSMLRSAIAEKRATEASLVEARNDAIRQVWDAYTDFENSRSRMTSAQALVTASEASMEATLASFDQGFSDITDVQAQQVGLTEARESYSQARTDFFLSASLLQFATGQLSADHLE